jgi:hypothetical protein
MVKYIYNQLTNKHTVKQCVLLSKTLVHNTRLF